MVLFFREIFEKFFKKTTVSSSLFEEFSEVKKPVFSSFFRKKTGFCLRGEPKFLQNDLFEVPKHLAP